MPFPWQHLQKRLPLSFKVPGKAAGSTAALTFDDGPHNNLTPEALRILKSFGATATFFMPGYAVQQAPDLALRIVEEGHSIGNHSLHHRGFGDCRPESNYGKLKRRKR